MKAIQWYLTRQYSRGPWHRLGILLAFVAGFQPIMWSFPKGDHWYMGVALISLMVAYAGLLTWLTTGEQDV